jgi:phosphomannomutase
MATGKIKFGTDGFRGIIADDFTFENVKKITNAIAEYIFETSSDKTVLIGYDPRFMADKFAHFSAEILADFGFKVLLSSKVVPTPVIAYAATVEKDCAGAVMFTASHNPKEYLGIKFIPNYGGPATKEMTDKIVSLIDTKNPELKNDGSIIEKDFGEEYFKHIESLIDFNVIKSAAPKFIYDGLYSASIGYFDTLLKRNGIDFESTNLHYDPDFGGGLPEPKEKYMHHKKEGFLTFANDGDADRYGVIDEKGEYISPNIIMAILLKYLSGKDFRGKMIKTVGVSQIIDIVSKKLGIETITTPVGFKWLSEKMRENDTILAGEDSGGLSTGCHIPEKDGIFANLLILEAVSSSNKPLYELKDEILKFAGTEFLQDRVDIKLKSDEEKKALMEQFSQVTEICGHKIFDILKIDGVKFFFDKKDNNSSSWILMRESGTEPLLRFYIETGSKENLEKIKEFIKNKVATL